MGGKWCTETENSAKIIRGLICTRQKPNHDVDGGGCRQEIPNHIALCSAPAMLKTQGYVTFSSLYAFQQNLILNSETFIPGTYSIKSESTALYQALA